MKKTLSFILLFVGLSLVSQAAYLKDIPRMVIQPNGDTLHCFATGDEFYNYLHDANGYTIVQDAVTGYFVYAVRTNNEILPSHYVAGQVNPAAVGLSPRITISSEEWRHRRERWIENIPERPRLRSDSRNKGHINNLVVFIRFSGDNNLTTSFTTIEDMFNDSTTISANSMYNYFKATSYNQLSITSTFYPAPSGNTILSYQDSYPREYYMPYSSTNQMGYSGDNERASREFALLSNAVNHISSSVPSSLNIDYDNDGYVDNVCFVVKGNVGDWSELLWPHRWALYGQYVYINGKRVYDFNFQLEGSSTYFNNSVLSHEMFHTLGAPDLYHYDADYDDLQCVGPWDLMENNTTPPQHSGAYMKLKYGNWIDSIPEITAPGVYALKPIGATSSENNAYAIATEDPNQRLIFEYRNTDCNFESGLPGSGLLIYRIDTRYNGNASYDGNTELDEVYLFRPNGSVTTNGNIHSAHFSQFENRTDFNSNTSPYPFLNYNTLIDISISNITVYGDSLTFQYNGAFPQYIVAATANWGGTISPAGSTFVNAGDSLQVNITPDEGFIIEDVVVNGNSIGPLSSYTFYSVSQNHSIEAFFITDGDPEITISEDTLRFNTPVGVAAPEQTLSFTYNSARDTVSFSLPQNSPFEISQNGIIWGNQLAILTNPISLQIRYAPFTVQNDTAILQISMSRLDTSLTIVLLGETENRSFTIATTQSTGGAISPAGTTTVNWDSSVTLHFTPDSDYYTKNIIINGQHYPGDSTYILQNIRSDYTVSAIFQPIPHALFLVDTSDITFETAINAENPTQRLSVGSVDIFGTITCRTTGKFYLLDANNIPVRNLSLHAPGGFITLQYVPTIAGSDTASLIISSDEVLNPLAIRLIGVCHPVNYQISAMYSSGGEVVPSGNFPVIQSGNVTIQIIPDENYQLGYLIIDDEIQENFNEESYTFDNVLRNHTLYAYFALKSGVGEYKENDISIYPNPANNELSIRINNSFVDFGNYAIYDIQGRQIVQGDCGNSERLDISTLNSGFYILKITVKNRVYQAKFIKQ